MMILFYFLWKLQVKETWSLGSEVLGSWFWVGGFQEMSDVNGKAWMTTMVISGDRVWSWSWD